MNSGGKKFIKLTNCICKDLRRSSRNISQIYNKNLKKSGEIINTNQVSILVALTQFKKIKISKICQQLNMERTTISRNLNVLKKYDLIYFVSGADNRIKFVNISDEGKRVLIKIFPFWENAQNQIKKLLGKDLDILQNNLKKLF